MLFATGVTIKKLTVMEIFAASNPHPKNLLEDYNYFSVVTNKPDVSLLIYVENCRSVFIYLSFYFSKNRKTFHICFMSQLHS